MQWNRTNVHFDWQLSVGDIGSDWFATIRVTSTQQQTRPTVIVTYRRPRPHHSDVFRCRWLVMDDAAAIAHIQHHKVAATGYCSPQHLPLQSLFVGDTMKLHEVGEIAVLCVSTIYIIHRVSFVARSLEITSACLRTSETTLNQIIAFPTSPRRRRKSLLSVYIGLLLGHYYYYYYYYYYIISRPVTRHMSIAVKRWIADVDGLHRWSPSQVLATIYCVWRVCVFVHVCVSICAYKLFENWQWNNNN